MQSDRCISVLPPKADIRVTHHHVCYGPISDIGRTNWHSANQAIEDGVALTVLLEGRDPTEVPDILKQYEKLRRVRTDVIQAEARKNGLRYDSRYPSLEQRDREIANLREFRRSVFDYDVERAAIAARSEGR